MSLWSRAFGGKKPTAPPASIPSKLNVEVVSVADVALNVRSFVLKAINGTKLPALVPGSHVDVYMTSSLSRPYSVFKEPQSTSNYRIAVKREEASRGGSQFMHESLSAGDRLELGYPRNNFALNEGAAHTILLAGGIGITPIMSMAGRLAELGKSFELRYFAQSAEHAAFHQELEQSPFASQVHFNFGLDRATIAERLGRSVATPASDTDLYICGPQGFIDLAQTMAMGSWPHSAVHIERFSADPVTSAGPQSSFEVRLARSGKRYQVPANRSILEVLEQNGITTPNSCRQGICGSCVTGVLGGEPDHLDTFLSARDKAAGDQMCVCVSRARTKILVLDT